MTAWLPYTRSQCLLMQHSILQGEKGERFVDNERQRQVLHLDPSVFQIFPDLPLACSLNFMLHQTAACNLIINSPSPFGCSSSLRAAGSCDDGRPVEYESLYGMQGGLPYHALHVLQAPMFHESRTGMHFLGGESRRLEGNLVTGPLEHDKEEVCRPRSHTPQTPSSYHLQPPAPSLLPPLSSYISIPLPRSASSHLVDYTPVGGRIWPACCRIFTQLRYYTNYPYLLFPDTFYPHPMS